MVNAHDFAVMAAVSRYPGWPNRDLQGPVNDLADFALWLLEKNGGGIPQGNASELVAWLKAPNQPAPSTFSVQSQVLFFVSPGGSQAQTMTIENAVPVTERVEAALLGLHRRGVKARSGVGNPRIGRRLYIFLAGHGFQPSAFGKYETALLMADATADEPGLHVLGRAYADHFVDSNIFDEVVLIMDCCREPNEIVPVRNTPFRRFTGPSAPRPNKAFCAFATGGGQESREITCDVNGKSVVRGVFTKALLEGLRGAQGSGPVTAPSLERWVLERVPKLYPASASQPQQPEFDFDRTYGANFIFCTPDEPTANLRILVTGEGATTLDVQVKGGPAKAVVPAVARNGAVWEYLLAPGLYEASIVGTDRRKIIREDMLGGPDVEL
jgi:hypothetical protein